MMPHAICTETSVIACATTLNGADPVHVTVLSVEVPDSVTR